MQPPSQQLQVIYQAIGEICGFEKLFSVANIMLNEITVSICGCRKSFLNQKFMHIVFILVSSWGTVFTA